MDKNIKEKLEKQDHFVKFLGKWIIIAIILFLIIQVSAGIIIRLNVPESQREIQEEYDKDYIGHWYNGTFFINMTVKENFESMEKYESMRESFNNNTFIKVMNVVSYLSIIPIGLLAYCIYKDYKKELLKSKTPLLLIMTSIFWIILNLLTEVSNHIDAHLYGDYGKGFIETCTYYPLFQEFIMPTLLLSLGVVFLHMQKKKNKDKKSKSENYIKAVISIIAIAAASFILIRFGIRLYELIMNLIGNHVNIRLPFYHRIFALPLEFAKSSGSYVKLVVLRFFKDLPVFIASSISVILFCKILFNYSKSKYVTKENSKMYKIIFISLFVSSVILNLVGLLEVNILNNEFLHQYKEATYTLAIRALCDPIFYLIFIYGFKHYIEKTYYLEYKDVKQDENN